MGNDRRSKKSVEALETHDIFAESNVGVGFEKLAALRRVIVFVARNQLHFDAFTFAQYAAVFGSWLELREIDPNLAAEIKTIQVARRWQKASVKNIRRRFARFRHRPDGVGKLIVVVIGVLFGKKKF